MKKLSTIVFLAWAFSTYAQTGNVGIGTTSPTTTLHVKGDAKYIIRQEDGVNTSTSFYTVQSEDEFGTFKKVPTDVFRGIQIVKLPTAGSTINQVGPGWQSTLIQIALPPGKWQITGAVVLRPTIDLSKNSNTVLNCQFSVADSPTGLVPSKDIITGATSGKGYSYGSYYSPSTYQMMKGNIFVSNSSGATKTYYFIANINRINNSSAGFTNFGSASEPENQIFALPIF